MTSRADEYRAKARECEERAEQTRDPFIKQQLLELRRSGGAWPLMPNGTRRRLLHWKYRSEFRYVKIRALEQEWSILNRQKSKKRHNANIPDNGTQMPVGD